VDINSDEEFDDTAQDLETWHENHWISPSLLKQP
jgi:hypothetical protein